MYYELMADIILGIVVITLILGMLSIIPMAININRRFIIWNRYFYNKRKWRIDLEH